MSTPILVRSSPTNGDNNFQIENTITLTFNKDIDGDTVNSGTIALINRDTSTPVRASYVTTDNVVKVLPALSLNEETGYKIIISGSDLSQFVGEVKDTDGNSLLNTQTILFTTGVRAPSAVVASSPSENVPPTTETVYVVVDDEPVAVETLPLEFVDMDPTHGEMLISPAYLAENGIRLTFNRPVNLASAQEYIVVEHKPMVDLRAMVYDVEDFEDAYAAEGTSTFCLDNRNEKLFPTMNYYVQGNDVLITYPGTLADWEAQQYEEASSSSSSSSSLPSGPTSTTSITEYNIYREGVVGEETREYNFGASETIYLKYRSFTVKDRFIVHQLGNTLFDSECVSTDDEYLVEEITITPNQNFSVTIIAGCDATQEIQGTAWGYYISNVDPREEESEDSSSSSESTSSESVSSTAEDVSSSAEDTPEPTPESSSSSSSEESETSSSSSITITTEGPTLNTDVNIYIKSGLRSQADENGAVMVWTTDDALHKWFMTGLFPIYTDIDLVRLELEALNFKHSDEKILRMILKNSIEAWKLSCMSYDLCEPPEDAITYAYKKTLLDFYDLTYIDTAVARGVSKRLGDFNVRVGARASNNKRNPKEDLVVGDVTSAWRALRVLCEKGIKFVVAIKGSMHRTTKPNFRTRTYTYLDTEQGWQFPTIKGASRYYQLPHYTDYYS